MDWSAFKAVPFGLVMFAVMIWRYYRRKNGQLQALGDYPSLARQLGLEHVKAQHSRQIGQLRGVMRGFFVAVDPDEQRKIIVRFRGEPGIDLRNYDLPRPPAKLEYFTSRERAINSYFKTSYADPTVAARLHVANLTQLIEPFRLRYRHEVKELNLTAHGVTCVLDFGTPSHIPATVVTELLPALIALAELIEPDAVTETVTTPSVE